MTSEPRRVLVVEDEFLIRLDVVERLAAEGHTLFEAADVEEAIVILQDTPIDVLFTDVDMPGTLDGVDLAARVDREWPHVAIVVTSGKGVIPLSDLPQGSRFYPKPYAYITIEEAIREMTA